MYKIAVTVGDCKGEITEGHSTNLNVILQDVRRHTSEKITLYDFLKEDAIKSYSMELNVLVKKQLCDELTRLELWRDGDAEAMEWFVDHVTITKIGTDNNFLFPVLKWIKSKSHHLFRTSGFCSLPQDDDILEYRMEKLEYQRKEYDLETLDTTLPLKISNLPSDERYSEHYKFTVNYPDLFDKASIQMGSWSAESWSSFSEIDSLFHALEIKEPQMASVWKQDWYFGHQRLAGCDPTHIKLCTHIPEKLAATERMLLPMLERLSLQEAITQRRLFIVDHDILHHLYCNNGHVVCAPIALFFLSGEQHLLPIAIQLFQDPALINPVYCPTDSEDVWTLAKMWFNNAEAQIHQGRAHYMVGHFLMEGISIMMQRHLSDDHPIFKLLAPHFHLLQQNNESVRDHLLAPDCPLESVLSCGSSGLYDIIRRSLRFWRMDVEGTLPADLTSRGVYDKQVLPGYHYRDDGLLVYSAVETYVTSYIKLYYDNDETVEEDFELQAWCRRLARCRVDGGLGINGVPNDGHLRTCEDLVLVITCIVFTCTAGHAAVGGKSMFEFYTFPPAYPLSLRGAPPSRKTRKRRPSIVKELGGGPNADVLSALPCKFQSAVGAVLGTFMCGEPFSRIGQSSVQYITDPEALQVVKKFRVELEEVSHVIKWRNMKRHLPYTCFDPANIPNTPFI